MKREWKVGDKFLWHRMLCTITKFGRTRGRSIIYYVWYDDGVEDWMDASYIVTENIRYMSEEESLLFILGQ